MMIGRFLLAVLYLVIHVYFITTAFTSYELTNTDTSFLPRTLILSTSLIFMMVIMWPTSATRVSMYYIFSYVVVYTAVIIMYATREPILGLLAVFGAVLGVGQSIRESPEWVGRYSPMIWGVFVFVLVWVFYSPDRYVDDLANTATKGDKIQDSLLPEGYLSGESTILATPIVVGLIMGIFSYGYFASAYKLRETRPQTLV